MKLYEVTFHTTSFMGRCDSFGDSVAGSYHAYNWHSHSETDGISGRIVIVV